jgi:hypothetical protein
MRRWIEEKQIMLGTWVIVAVAVAFSAAPIVH